MTDGLDNRKLLQLIKSLEKDSPMARVGILGDKNNRKDEGSNATIGAKHEFGNEGMPIRSFLRVPITDNLQKFLEKSGAFDKDALEQVVKSGSLQNWIEKVGIVAEDVVAEAFNTGGFGKWKPSDMRFKKNHQTLVETQQLRNSITSEVK